MSQQGTRTVVSSVQAQPTPNVTVVVAPMPLIFCVWFGLWSNLKQLFAKKSATGERLSKNKPLTKFRNIWTRRKKSDYYSNSASQRKQKEYQEIITDVSFPVLWHGCWRRCLCHVLYNTVRRVEMIRHILT